MRQRVILAAAVAIGLFAALLTRQYLSAKDREVAGKLAGIERTYRKVEVLVAAKPLPAGSVLTRDSIGKTAVFERQLRSDAIRVDDYPGVLGRKIVNRLDTGAPFFWSDVEGGAPGSGRFSHDVKPGCRAISINAAGAAAVSGMIRPNDRIDVIGTFSFPSREHPGELELVTFTIIQDVTVLATGTETAKSSPGGARRAASYSTVTLEVTPREAEMLVFAEQIKGRLTLALRNPSDVHYEPELPRVNFEKIEGEIERLNLYRQKTLLHKRDVR